MYYKIQETALLDEAATQRLLDALPRWRRDVALRFKHLAGQRECAVAYHLLCDLLREHYGILEPPHFIIGEHGKPTLLEHPDIHFNLSHCREAVICAVSDRPVGVDIECNRKISDALIRHTMNEEEIGQIGASTTPILTFLRFWTQKEAVVKLTGQGITDGIPSILIEATQKGIHIQTITNEQRGYVYSIAQ